MKRILAERAQKEETLQNFLRGTLGLTRHQISQAKFRPRGILVNGKQQRVTAFLKPGDWIEVLLEEEAAASSHLLPGQLEVRVLYEDEDILAVDKPAGIVVHPSHGHYQDSLANDVSGYFSRKGEQVKIRPIGRLDRETSGIVIFAKNQTAAARLADQKIQGAFRKRYFALTEGWITLKEGTINVGISRDETTLMKMKADPAGKRAVTHYRVLARGQTGSPGEGRNYSMAELEIETGRTHQIRVHMASIGHPLLGDQLYGAGSFTLSRAALHAGECTFFQPFTGQKICLRAELPRDMEEICSQGREKFW